MKSPKIALLSLASAVLVFGQYAQAQITNTNLYPLTFRAVCTSTNSSGVFQEQVLNANLIGDYAAAHNITNLNTLRLVYNRTNNSIQVVDTNGVTLFTSFAFTGGLSFTNTNNTLTVFQGNILVGTNTTASGVIFGSSTWNANLTNPYGLRAELFFIEPAVGTNAASLCRATLRVGSAMNEEDEENEGNEHGRGHGVGNGGTPPGNHYGWQVPANPHSRR